MKTSRFLNPLFVVFEIPDPLISLKYISIVALLFYSNIALFGQIVQFQTIPAPQNGTITVCQGSSLTFTNTSIGIPTGSSFFWDFPGGIPSSAIGEGPHVIEYNSLGSNNATLTVDGQSFSVEVNVISGLSSVIAMGAGTNFSVGTFNNQNYFLACDGNAANFMSVSSNSTGTTATSVHTISWGNGQPDFVYTGTNFTFHPVNLNSSTFYAPGTYTLTYTLTNGGCSSQISRLVYAGTPPGGSIENTLQTQSFCIPGNVVYNINTQANGPGTQYEILFNDGFNSTYSFSHPPPASIAHLFPSNSCGSVSTFDGTTYFNSFSVTMNTSNPCGQSTSGIAPIIISESPIAEYTISDTVICVNAPVNFANISFGGMNVTGGVSNGASSCSQQADVIWTANPTTNVNVLSGDMGTIFVTPIGTQWFPGTNDLTLSFSEPGTYSITLLVRNKPQCGIDSITKTICVIPELIADFSMQDTSVCAPYLFSPQNFSNSVACDNSNVFQWTITKSNPQSCPYGSSPGYEFLNGTNANSFEPLINFTTPGIYQVRLINSLAIPITGLQCQGDTLIKTLVIKDIPFISLEPLTFCDGSSYTLEPLNSACYADNGLVYNWNFAPSSASILSSNLPNPTISYASTGQFNYSVNVSNECGQMNSSAQVFVEAGINVQMSGPIIDCINSPLQLNSQITGGITTGTWSSDLIGGVFIPSPSVANPQFSFPNGFNGSITFTLTSDPSPNGCPPAIDSISVNINTSIFADAGNYAPVCMNSTLSLDGSFGGIASSATWASLGGGSFANPNDPMTTFTPPLNFVGDITLVLTTDDPPGDCLADTDFVVITVLPLPNVQASNDATICEGQNNIISAVGASDYNWDQNLGAGASHNISPTTTTTYIVTGTDSNGCTNSDEVTITVLPSPDINPIASVVYCANEQTNEIEFTSSFPAATFQWTRTPQNIGLAGNNGIGNLPPFTTNNSTNNVLISTFTVTPVASNCSGQPINFTVSVNPIPQITNASSQTLCPGNTTPVNWTTNLNNNLSVEFDWLLVSSGSNLFGAILSGQGNLPSMTVLNSGNQTESLVYEVQYQHDNCFGSPFVYTIFVNPGPVMDPIPSQEICSGTPFADATFASSVVGTSFTWELMSTQIPSTVSGFPQPDGVNFIPGTTVVNTGLTPFTLDYAVTPNAIGCPGVPELFQLTVNPELTVTTNISNQHVCNETNSQEVILQANVPNSSVSWQVTSLPADIVGVIPTGGFNVIPEFTLTNLDPVDIEIIVISLQPLNSDPNLCPGVPVNYTISVLPTPLIDNLNDVIYCNGDFTQNFIFTGSATNFSWSHDGNSIGLVNSGNSDINSFQITSTNQAQTEVVFTVFPQIIANNQICEGTPESFTITINPNGQVNTLPDITLCDDESTPQIDFTTDLTDGTLTYSWVNSNTTIGLTDLGSGVSIASFLAQNPGLSPNFATITVTPSYTNADLTCQGTAEEFIIQVNPIPQIVAASNTFICNSQTLNIAPLTNIPSDFVWQGQPNLQVNGISTTPQTSIAINDALTNVSGSSQIVHYTIAPVLPGTSCVGSSTQIEVAVEPNVFMTSPTVYEICSGTPVNSVLTSNVPVTYSWFGTPNPNVTGTTTIPNNSPIIQDVLINTTTTPQMVVYTVFPVTLSGNCQGAPLIVSVLVNPELQITSPNAQTICSGETLNMPLTANANGNFSWFATQNGQVIGETAQIQNTTLITDQLTNTSNVVQQVVYNIVVTSLDLGCSSQNFQCVVDVIPNPTLGNLADITVCHGAAVAEQTPNGAYTGIHWNNSNTNTGIASFANNAQVFAAFNAQNTNNFPITSLINLTPIFIHNQVTCTGTTNSFNITVNPLGQLSFVPNVEVCHDTPIAQTNLLTNNLNGTTVFTWTNDNLNTGLNLSSGFGNVPDFTGVNTFSPNPIVSNISVIAQYTFNNVTCPSQPINFQFIVNPIPVLDPIPNFTYCNNDVAQVFSFTGPGTNHYVWSHNNAAIGLPMNGFGNLPQFIATNVNQNNIQSQVQVSSFYNSTISSLSCPGSSQQFTITVQPSPLVDFQTDTTIYCSRNDVVFINQSGPDASFFWNFGDGNTSFLVNPTHQFAAFGIYQVTLTATNNNTGCSASITKPIGILETPIVNFSVDSAYLCYPAVFTFRDLVQTPFTSATWEFGDGLSIIQNDTAQHVYNDFGCYDVTLTVVSENGCKDSLSIVDMVCYYQSPIAYFTTDQIVYLATDPLVTFSNQSMFSTSYFWDFGDQDTSTAINPFHYYPDIEMNYGIILTAYNEIGCSHQYGAVISIIEDKIFYVPNSFTPENKDGSNDIFQAVITSGYNRDIFHCIIYNSWGEVVFETSDINQGWDGLSSKGLPCPDGSYIWQITLHGIGDRDATVFTGHVNLLR